MPTVPADPVGRRVAVRRRLPDGRLTDVVGVIVGADDATLVVRDRAGARHPMARHDLVAITTPPTGAGLTPPHRRRAVDVAVDDLVAAQAAGWQPTETVALGEWQLRTAGGFTERANSALTVGDPGSDLPAALRAVTDHYRTRCLPPRLLIVDPLDHGVDQAAAAAGWRRGTEVLVMVADLPELAASAAAAALSRGDAADGGDGTGRPDGDDGPGGTTVQLATEPDDEWLAVARYEGRPIPDHGIALLRRGDPLFATAIQDGIGVGVARGTRHGDWFGLTAMTVAAEHRQRGVGSALADALIGWAASQQARWAWLQVAAGNAPARRMYAGRGFAEHHRYHYREAG